MQQGRQGRCPFQRKAGLRLHVALLAAALACPVQALPVPSAAPAGVVYSFDIPAQPLSGALRQFVQQSRLEILFTPGLVAGKRSPGVVGSLSPPQALDALLKDCGITWSTTSGGTILLHEQSRSTIADPVRQDN